MVFSTTDEDNNQHLVVGSTSNAGLQAPLGTTTPPGSSVTSSILRAPQPIFAVVAAPLITSTSREALLEWLKLRKAYEEATRERNGKEDYRSVLKGVRSSFDADLLNTLCEASWGVEKDELTDEFLIEKIHAITDNYQNQAPP
ncbi:LOW QUALITY PROTEIN: Cleavage induced protein [Phytophthora megakarya]|uniref:Cleavage induced protein n=1 Tax=Phytophthora megakarya TaxID=4795 RepID=A0A225UJQ8_9STRA|nr:LOW QUALITY PROTEIN: Cleavage induced protein [Phytophthora megakarya]